jgi:hypothetical protein
MEKGLTPLLGDPLSSCELFLEVTIIKIIREGTKIGFCTQVADSHTIFKFDLKICFEAVSGVLWLVWMEMIHCLASPLVYVQCSNLRWYYPGSDWLAQAIWLLVLRSRICVVYYWVVGVTTI